MDDLQLKLPTPGAENKVNRVNIRPAFKVEYGRLVRLKDWKSINPEVEEEQRSPTY